MGDELSGLQGELEFRRRTLTPFDKRLPGAAADRKSAALRWLKSYANTQPAAVLKRSNRCGGSQLKRRCACRRAAMVSRLFVGVGELDQSAIVIGSPDETNAGWQVVARETGGNDDGRNID